MYLVDCVSVYLAMTKLQIGSSYLVCYPFFILEKQLGNFTFL